MARMTRDTVRRYKQKLEDTFNRHNIDLDPVNEVIVVWYGIRSIPGDFPTIWIPFSGGPIHGTNALQACHWLVDHIEKFRSLLPKRLQNWVIEIRRV